MSAASKTLSAQATREREVIYNVKKRPVRFEKRDGRIVVECTYDTMGRRATKKVTTNGTVAEHRRFLYRGYLQIDSPPPHRRLTPSGQSRFAHCPTGLTAVGRLACCDLLRPSSPVLWAILWDPTQPTATRPLAIQKNRTWYTHAYTPYGEVTLAHADAQPLRRSSEYHDPELGLVYYNYRHYNPTSGRWTGQDAIPRPFLYDYAWNNPLQFHDYLGLLNLSQNQPDVPTAPTAPTVVMLPSAKTGVDCSICESKLPDIRDYIRNTYKNKPSHDLCCERGLQ